MRSCRRFLAGIPHCKVGHPCATHPSATPSRCRESVRLACVRHAASVYPEPGSNSPFRVFQNLSSEILPCCCMTSLVTLTGSIVTYWFLTTLQLFKFRPMLPHLVRSRLSQAHGDNTTAFAPCQEVFYEFSENSKNPVL